MLYAKGILERKGVCGQGSTLILLFDKMISVYGVSLLFHTMTTSQGSSPRAAALSTLLQFFKLWHQTCGTCQPPYLYGAAIIAA